MNALGLAALSARYYVRGGMDPHLGPERALSASLARLLGQRGLPRDHRAALAAALIRGWVECRPQPTVSAPIMHRLWPDGTRVYVQDAALGNGTPPATVDGTERRIG